MPATKRCQICNADRRGRCQCLEGTVGSLKEHSINPALQTKKGKKDDEGPKPQGELDDKGLKSQPADNQKKRKKDDEGPKPQGEEQPATAGKDEEQPATAGKDEEQPAAPWWTGQQEWDRGWGTRRSDHKHEAAWRGKSWGSGWKQHGWKCHYEDSYGRNGSHSDSSTPGGARDAGSGKWHGSQQRDYVHGGYSHKQYERNNSRWYYDEGRGESNSTGDGKGGAAEEDRGAGSGPAGGGGSSAKQNAAGGQAGAARESRGPDYLGYYSTLGVSWSCTVVEVNKAYQKLALQFHPDKTTTSPVTVQAALADLFRRATQARTVLATPALRADYDRACWGKCKPGDLPSGWTTKRSRTTGKEYYFNSETGESTFTKPTA